MFPPAPSFPSFPHPQAAPPFKCAPTGGPFQSGFAPFYPYAGYPDTHNVKQMGMPEGVREIRAAPKRKKSQKRTWAGGSQDVNIVSSDANIDDVVDKIVESFNLLDFDMFRMEMCLIGFHAPIMAGIDYMGLKVSRGEEPVAVSIVSSGGYEDNSEDGDVLFYSGQGGNVNNRGMEITDQKLERGNVALEKSLHRVQLRLSGQPETYTVWKSFQQWKDGSAARVGLILQDLAFGAESIPVSLVNDVDDEKAPANFTYYPGLRYSEPVNSNESSTGCDCHGGCIASKSNCPCIQRNGGYLPYTTNGVLVSQKALIHECGSSCMCPPNCKNRARRHADVSAHG
ncbi:Histone-lysine N-methyltransferase, H3 lysine-9 specific SUVH1 [Hibiscus syriacus]|uniref:Histone-lysine N-methyltransferase, H3 lysine-9 specific SUVH1 n=1 Tax=Hibiscus syriacus TaxID=106335 RepID=A0A6A2YEW7_HIBSY|nr:Histone-lysine N-methyltransferase, H3 lysine-9 specific SUVH1 [Hibiscus syriacus]